MNKPYFIAEVGVNFYDTAKVENISPLEAAKRYIKEAKKAGADAVKFQAYKADTIVSKNSPAYWDLDEEPTKTQYDLFKRHDGFNKEEYQQLAEYCKKMDIGFMATPFDFESADFLEELMDIYKISSSDLSNLPFIRYIAKKGKPILLSVGAAFLSEIEEAVRVIKEEGVNDICLMHCVLSYPTKYEDANLNVIKTLRKVFPDLKVGYSDHTLPDETMSILTCAFLYGAEIIEKHFTLDKNLKGNDHYHAGDKIDIERAIRNFEKVCIASGRCEKRVLQCEEMARKQARRSIVVIKDMKKGERIFEKNVMFKRPGTGISPQDIDVLLGKAVNRDITADTVLTWDMFLE
ncbi:N-acetylneuraminate synthase family protein [Lachnospiraceae bacterium 42-17]|jgi:sialic acid synthase SpsE|nr:acetylneuraminic acid synthetase [Oscillospiraceae bacterium]